MQGSKSKIRSSALINFFITLLLFFCCSSAGAEDSASVKPVAQAPQASFDWGSVVQGATVSHDFTVKNVGNAELIIQKIVPACGCTATSTSSDRIAIGGETTIHVQLDTTGFAGKKEKTIRLFTNDPDNPYTVLTMTGVIEPDIIVEPQRLSFAEIVRGELKAAPTMEFTIKTRPGSKAQLTDVSTYSKFLSIKERVSRTDSKTVQVSLNPEVPTGEFRDRIIVGVKGGTVNAVNVPVLASIKGQVQLKPATLSFGVISGTGIITKKTRLQNLGATGVSIKGIESEDVAVSAQFKVVKPGKIFDIEVSVDPTKVKKDLRSALTINTDGTSEAPLILSIYGILPPKG